MNQKGFVNIMLIVVIVMLLGVVGYLALTKKSEPIIQEPASAPVDTEMPIPEKEVENWQNFRNERFGYELQLPREWVIMAPPENPFIEDTSCSASPVATSNSSTIVIAKKQLDICGFYAHSVPSHEAEMAISVFPGRISNLTTILEPPYESVTIAGENAVMYRFSFQQARPNVNATRIYINHGDNQYLIFLKNQNSQGTSYDPIYDQILSTFNFTP